MEDVEIVVTHHERATVRVGEVFLKIDGDQARIDAEVEAMVSAPIPTAKILWRKPSVLALATLSGTALGPAERTIIELVCCIGGTGELVYPRSPSGMVK
ncbi:hypothetical protein [Nocardia sp. NPDC059228]|uniref:hypothetical protein n=1 Tax=Nocardia sp. NPDC059228 TaxID=3346777 RepID=UPI003677D5C5